MPAVKVFTPESVSVALPVFTSEPPVPMIAPLKVVELPPPIVSTLFCKFTVPDPSKPPTDSELASFNIPAALTVIAEASGRALPPERVRVPAFTEVNPVKVFTAPRVNSEAPVFTKS